jgi:hypothetical protein
MYLAQKPDLWKIYGKDILIQKVCNPFLNDIDGNTMLDIAISTFSHECFLDILHLIPQIYGFPVFSLFLINHTNTEGAYPLCQAVKVNNQKAFDMLLQTPYNADILTTDNSLNILCYILFQCNPGKDRIHYFKSVIRTLHDKSLYSNNEIQTLLQTEYHNRLLSSFYHPYQSVLEVINDRQRLPDDTERQVLRNSVERLLNDR